MPDVEIGTCQDTSGLFIRRKSMKKLAKVNMRTVAASVKAKLKAERATVRKEKLTKRDEKLLSHWMLPPAQDADQQSSLQCVQCGDFYCEPDVDWASINM